MASPPRAGAKPGALVDANQAWALLETKFASRYTTVRRAFIELDADKDGVINMKEFRHALEVIGLFMTGPEFRKLWKQFDTTGDGNISYVEFNNKIGRLITPVGVGLDMKRPETPKLKPWQEKAIAKQMARKVKDIDATFAMFDTDGSGRISHAEFTHALRKLGIHLGDAESFDMMSKYKKARPAGSGMNTGGDGGGMEITIDEFRAAMTEYFKVVSGPEDPADSNSLIKEAEQIIEKVLPKSMGIDAILNRFKPYDEFRSKEITYEQFKQALEAAGARMSAQQFNALCTKADPISDGLIDYELWTVEFCGGRPQAAQLHGANHIYKPWARLGLRPVTDPVSGKPFSRDELAIRFAGPLGMSVAETKLVQSLVGRKQDVMAAFAAFDKDGSGELTIDEFEAALSKMDADLDASKELVKVLFDKFDTNKNGRIEWMEWWSKIGSFMGIGEANLRRIGLEKMSVKELATLGLDPKEVMALRDTVSMSELTKEMASVYRITEGANLQAAGSPAGKTGGKTLAGRSSAAAAAAAAAMGADGRSVATDALDLGPTGQKMKKLLGRSWMTVAQDVQKRAAAKEAAATGSAPSPAKGGSTAVPGSLLRDALAEKGVALTSKEIRAISSRYAAPGTSSAAKKADPEAVPVDVEKLFIDAASGTMAVAPKLAATVKIPTRRG